ncbi:1-acyl-sn-glycerol-3-phosphate acyltransferase [Bifidobacterium adolescentis]|uniref:lysophospholipid acyltransferase family protein n=1 Tax=Bifidobacterium adolescentis TaxID=1680 RepID=UPI000DA0AD7B|nr:1-acyl-sn-glycerol-3-phosphate acyltransferase [Bifidobacterium adolescentis]SPU23676.1 1-acyl-sn-glycerol-3-phosphate acyltransferase [Bifidobacterium adolescentis]
MFTFVIWDKNKQELFGARDHFGIKPFYYAKMNGTFMYASEIKSLLRHPDFVKELNAEALKPYMTFQYPAIGETFFKGVYKLPEGHYFTYRDGKMAWGLEHVPETGPFITAATHVTMYDVFVPMVSMFHQGRRPRYMAKAEMAKWPLIGKWFQLVGMQPVQRRAGKAKAIEETSVEILTSGRPLTVWPEGTVTRDPQKWPMSMKNGVGVIALESSRRLGYQVPLYCAVTWGAASINHWWPWPRKNVVMCYDEALDYADLLDGCDSWGDEVPTDRADELTRRIRVRMTEIMAEIRGEQAPDGYWDYRTMSRVKD